MSRHFRFQAGLWPMLAVWVAFAGVVQAQTAPPAPAATTTASVSFYSPRTVLWLGRTAVLPFRSTQAYGDDSTLSASLSDASIAEVIRPPALLAGETTGYLRVRALRPGRTRLTVQGSAVIDLEVKPDPAGAAFAGIDVESARPRIVSPMPDAAVWGQFAVGVEVFDAAEIPPGPGVVHKVDSAVAAPTVGNDGPTVRLRLPGGRMLDAVARTGAEFGPVRHYQFNVPAAELPAGPLSLVAVSVPNGFTEVDRRAGRGAPLESQPLTLRNLRAPRADALLSGECENPSLIGSTKELYAPARPARFGTRQPDVNKDDAASGGQTVACGNAWCLPVVIKEPGEYQFFIQARGEFAGGAFATAGLYLDNSEIPLGTVRLTGAKYQRLPVGSVIRLDAGPQLLTVAFKNGFGHGKENRNLCLDSFELLHISELPAAATAAGHLLATQIIAVPTVPTVPVAASGDYRLTSLPLPGAASPPRLGVLYPANGAAVYGVDAVVGRASGFGTDRTRAAWVDVLIDGQPQGVRLVSPVPSELMVFPLLLRQIPAGSHRLALRAADLDGHVTESPAQPINVLPEPPFARGPYERAVYLLDRLAFGAEPRELAAVLTLGETSWLNQRLAAGFDTPTEQALLHIAARRYPRIDDQGQTARRALNQWIASDNPVRSRFTAWVENHFSTWMNKTEGTAEWHSHLDFCRLGVAPFADLLSASAHSPAMLVYLDQAKSYANKLNENYAREIMELHTLGVHGGYSQTDVTALASVLNGWTVVREAALPQQDGSLQLVNNNGNDAGLIDGFRFAPVLSDGKGQRVFGMRFPAADPAARYDRVRLALEMLASHPSTAEHVCRKLAEHYVGDPAPEPLVRQMTGVYLENGGELSVVLRAMVAHQAFWSATPKMATPFDYGLRIARLCRASLVQMGADPDQSPNPDQVENFLKKSGMGMFDRVTPDGYPQSDDVYADSNALLQRWHFMEEMTDALNRLVPKAWRALPDSVSQPPSHAATTVSPGAAQRFIDLAAVRLTGRLLTPASNQAALDLLGTGASPEQFSQALLFVSLLPETSLR